MFHFAQWLSWTLDNISTRTDTNMYRCENRQAYKKQSQLSRNLIISSKKEQEEDIFKIDSPQSHNRTHYWQGYESNNFLSSGSQYFKKVAQIEKNNDWVSNVE